MGALEVPGCSYASKQQFKEQQIKFGFNAYGMPSKHLRFASMSCPSSAVGQHASAAQCQ